MKSIGHFKGKCDIRIWLCQIAKNSYFIYLRKHKELEEEDMDTEQVLELDILERICEEEESSRLNKIVHHLNKPYKEVFLLRVYGELRFKQIADLFQKSDNWVCVTYHRAK